MGTRERRGWFSRNIAAVLVCVLAGASIPFLARADRATSTSFIIESGVVDAGGGQSTSSGFNVRTSIGQPGTGISTSTSFTVRGGFLYFPSPISAPTSTPPPVTPAPPAGGGGLLAPFFPEPLLPEEILTLCDFNGDSRCNMIDLSIMLYYYNRTGSSIARYDLNRSGKVDFPDVSVLMFYWREEQKRKEI